jgi:hypothetical protein
VESQQHEKLWHVTSLGMHYNIIEIFEDLAYWAGSFLSHAKVVGDDLCAR